MESHLCETSTLHESIQSAEIVLPCSPFDETLAFFTKQLGFQLNLIFPADNPAIAVVSGYGLTLRLERTTDQSTLGTAVIRLNVKNDSELFSNNATEMVAPNGTKIQIVKEGNKLVIPPNKQSLVVCKLASDAAWIKGRAGMLYRDLIPSRQGGRFIASHIRIPTGGPVPDYVHYHEIRFQMIYVYQGWVRLVYEDQGLPFVLQAGDCVLQPPLIRHRVLESSDGLEVIEIACPATHNTCIDHRMQLPNTEHQVDRDYGGQRFVKFLAEDKIVQWQPWRMSGFEYRDTGISLATEDLAAARIVRHIDNSNTQSIQHRAEFVFIFILSGSLTLHITDHDPDKMKSGDSCVIPENVFYHFSECSEDLKFLEVTLPAKANTSCE